MLSRCLSIGGGGGGGQHYAEPVDTTQNSVTLSFEPSMVILDVGSYGGSGNPMYEYWQKDVNSGKTLQVYAGTPSWYTLSPSSSYAGIQYLDGKTLYLQSVSSLNNAYLYAYE